MVLKATEEQPKNANENGNGNNSNQFDVSLQMAREAGENSTRAFYVFQTDIIIYSQMV